MYYNSNCKLFLIINFITNQLLNRILKWYAVWFAPSVQYNTSGGNIKSFVGILQYSSSSCVQRTDKNSTELALFIYHYGWEYKEHWNASMCWWYGRSSNHRRIRYQISLCKHSPAVVHFSLKWHNLALPCMYFEERTLIKVRNLMHLINVKIRA